MAHTDYQQVAKEMLDMWQKQLTGVMNDKRFIHAMLDMLHSFQPSDANASKPTASTHTATTSGHDAGVLDELAYRLAMCERRIAALEKQSTPKKAAPKRRAGSKKPR